MKELRRDSVRTSSKGLRGEGVKGALLRSVSVNLAELRRAGRAEGIGPLPCGQADGHNSWVKQLVAPLLVGVFPFTGWAESEVAIRHLELAEKFRVS